MQVLKIEKENSDIKVILDGYSIESDLYFYGEQEVIPFSLKIDDEYIQVVENRLSLTINEKLFNNRAIESDYDLYLYDMSQRTKCKIESTTAHAYKISGNLIYDYEVCVQNAQLFVKVRKKPYKFKLNEINVIDDKSATLIFEDFGFSEMKLVLAKRVSEKLWRYRDNVIDLGKLVNNQITYSISSERLLTEGNETYFYDYLIEIAKENQKAKYFVDLNCDNFTNDLISEYSNQFGTIGLYKSGGNHLTLRGKVGFERAELLDFYIDEEKVKMRISCSDASEDTLNIQFNKRTYSGKSNDFCYSRKFECVKNGTEYLFERNLVDLLGEYIQGKDEHWDIYLKGNKKYVIQTKGLVATKYYSMGEYQATFFDTAGKLALYTHDGSHSTNNKVRIGVVGTCFTRSVFKSQPYFNPDYKRFYNCCLTQFHSSLISLGCSETIDEGLLNQVCMDKEAKLYLPTDLNKDFFERLQKANLSYLVIDNYIDATRPIVEIEPGTYFTLNKYISNQKITRFIGQQWRVIRPGSEEHVALYEKYAKLFIDKVKEYIPESHIILVQGRFSTKKINEKTGEITEWSGKEYIQKNNLRWDKVDSILRKIAPKMRVINMRSTRYVSDINSPIPGGASPSHYQKYYYKEVLDAINKIVLEDVLNLR